MNLVFLSFDLPFSCNIRVIFFDPSSLSAECLSDRNRTCFLKGTAAGLQSAKQHYCNSESPALRHLLCPSLFPLPSEPFHSFMQTHTDQPREYKEEQWHPPSCRAAWFAPHGIHNIPKRAMQDKDIGCAVPAKPGYGFRPLSAAGSNAPCKNSKNKRNCPGIDDLLIHEPCLNSRYGNSQYSQQH